MNDSMRKALLIMAVILGGIVISIVASVAIVAVLHFMPINDATKGHLETILPLIVSIIVALEVKDIVTPPPQVRWLWREDKEREG